jgi:hypothetical protein
MACLPLFAACSQQAASSAAQNAGTLAKCLLKVRPCKPYAAAADGYTCSCSKIAEAEAVVSVNEKKWLVMQLQHSLTWVHCVQAVAVVGQEVAAQCKDQDAPNHLEAGLQQLLASLVAAAHLSGLAGLPQQVSACNMGHATSAASV